LEINNRKGDVPRIFKRFKKSSSSSSLFEEEQGELKEKYNKRSDDEMELGEFKY
jgi:hypothetical protein